MQIRESALSWGRNPWNVTARQVWTVTGLLAKRPFKQAAADTYRGKLQLNRSPEYKQTVVFLKQILHANRPAS